MIYKKKSTACNQEFIDISSTFFLDKIDLSN